MSDTPVTDDFNVIESLRTSPEMRKKMAERYRKEDLAELAYTLDFDIGCLIGYIDTALMYLECGQADLARKTMESAHGNFSAQRKSRRRYWGMHP
ncbi:hypothetical protein [Sansalvadorimonas verongulae]|uniref:hypothetical protein n=1 Tax=Sansalvadorimonas verongulae TaxID=2172824 RepID=UPI0012BD5788|nr:hypothetical protein [Sansalvadorimonas verongulae]MTI12092.1 hypothetical protein [Sansalvadorimonas verongulae]